MEKLFDNISQFTKLSNENREMLASIVKRMDYRKNQVILKENAICNHIYFVDKGITRTFYYKDGKDITDWISVENTFACSIVSLITRKPDRRGIEALEDCTLYALPFYELEQLYHMCHEIEHLGRLLTNHGIVQMQQRFDDLHFATATERYQKIIINTPDIIRRIPLGILASYLGITQETLSRIRSNK